MKLPVIKSLTEFIQENDADYVHEAIEVLEHLAQSDTLQDEETDVIGELLSNMYGSIEVAKMIRQGQPPREALNAFMKRVVGSIDR